MRAARTSGNVPRGGGRLVVAAGAGTGTDVPVPAPAPVLTRAPTVAFGPAVGCLLDSLPAFVSILLGSVIARLIGRYVLHLPLYL